MRRAIGILLLTGLLPFTVRPQPAAAGNTQSTHTAASNAAVRADFNGDSQADLAIGASRENDASGVVHVLYGSPSGLSAAGSQLWSQDSPGIAGTAESADYFGGALTTGPLSTSGAGPTTNPAVTSPTARNRSLSRLRPHGPRSLGAGPFWRQAAG
jgi:hypothetical protein